MSLYTFYPLRSDGSSDGYATSYLADDREAAITAQQMLDRHRRAARVVVGRGERELFVEPRVQPHARAPR